MRKSIDCYNTHQTSKIIDPIKFTVFGLHVGISHFMQGSNPDPDEQSPRVSVTLMHCYTLGQPQKVPLGEAKAFSPSADFFYPFLPFPGGQVIPELL